MMKIPRAVPRFVLLAFLIACGGFMACGGAEQVEPDKISLKELESVLHVKFPEGTVAVGLMKMEERDRIIRLKVTMPSAAWPEFLKSAPIDELDLSEKRRFFLGEDEGWWDPSKPASLPTAQGRLENGSVLNVGVDQSDSAKATVYLMWHET